MRRFDIAIVGGGLVGSAAAVALAKKDYGVVHFAPLRPEDCRSSALMAPVVDFLTDSGLIEHAESPGEPLRRIRIIDATARLIRAPEVLFDAAEIGRDAFGWNFANAPLLAHFAALGATLPGLTVIAGSAGAFERQTEGFIVTPEKGDPVSVRLLVGADGRRSPVRTFAGIRVSERPIAETALVSDLELGRPLDGTAIEFHYENGPFTLVPAGGKKANLVWIDKREVLERARAGDLAAVLGERSRHLFGTVAVSGPAFVFPLAFLGVATAGIDDVVLVGEAAHAFPPIGAQGLNLGLRDVADLIAVLANEGRTRRDWPARVALAYADRRAADLGRTGAGVEILFRSLLAGFLPVEVARAGGLWALKLSPGLRRMVMNAGMGWR